MDCGVSARASIFASHFAHPSLRAQCEGKNIPVPPASASASASTNPNPLPPPVTTKTFPLRSNRFLVCVSGRSDFIWRFRASIVRATGDGRVLVDVGVIYLDDVEVIDEGVVVVNARDVEARESVVWRREDRERVNVRKEVILMIASSRACWRE